MAKKAEDSLARVEKHLIRPSSPWFPMIAGFCHLAKNLYNHANHIVRNRFVKDNYWTRYDELDKILKHDLEFPDYRAMPTAQSAQQVLRLLDKNWKSFFAAIKDWKEHKEKYLGRPRLPKYKKKDGQSVLVLTNQNCRYADGKIRFPKAFGGFEVVPEFASLPVDEHEARETGKTRIFSSFQQVRFVPCGAYIVMEIVYTIRPVAQQEDNGRYAGIDIGVDNLMAMATNTGDAPLLVRGRYAKSANRLYNKELAYWKSVCMMTTGRFSLRTWFRKLSCRFIRFFVFAVFVMVCISFSSEFMRRFDRSCVTVPHKLYRYFLKILYVS